MNYKQPGNKRKSEGNYNQPEKKHTRPRKSQIFIMLLTFRGVTLLS